MLALNLIVWWYSKGWKTFFRRLMEKISDHADYFSFGTIFRTFFAPFRQIDSGSSSSGGLSARLSDWLGRLISRFIGAFVRLFIMIAGLITIIIEFIFGLLIGLIWPFMPFLPIACIVLFFSGITFGVDL